jgi:hypothetical protein
MDSEQKDFMEMARARQMELPPDMRQKVQRITKKESVKATKDQHFAVRHLGHARAGLEEALQARFNLLIIFMENLSARCSPDMERSCSPLRISGEGATGENPKSSGGLYLCKSSGCRITGRSGEDSDNRDQGRRGRTSLGRGKPQLRSRPARSTRARPA